MQININRLSVQDVLFNSIIRIAVFFIVFIFCWILWELCQAGLEKISWDFLTQAPKRSGREGGIYPMLVSTLWILLIAISIALPLGLGCAIWLAEFVKASNTWKKQIDFVLDVLAGVPSIVFGLFGYAFFCIFLGLGFSILAGGITLACMMLPLLIRTSELGLNAVPDEWRHAGAALGMSRVTLIIKVLLPYAMPAITAGLLLAIGRAIAETAALIFTSGYVDRMPDSIHDSGRALAVHIYDLSMNVLGGDKAAYATALVLISLIIFINIIANLISHYGLAKRVHR
jgi:phosphate transport system permease protein